MSSDVCSCRLVGLKMMAAASEEEEVPVESVSKDAASSAKDYLEQHGLLKYVQSLLHAVIQVKPTDPYAYMILGPMYMYIVF